jgi:hypothetical protein
MTNHFRASLLAGLLLYGGAASAAPATTTLSASSTVPAAQDGCLDHSVKELGMSAKKVDGERRWVIGPQYLHPSVIEGGAFGIRFEKGEKETAIKVDATWTGGKKPAALQPELEARVMAMVTKVTQLCGAFGAKVSCSVQEAGGAAEACKPAP